MRSAGKSRKRGSEVMESVHCELFENVLEQFTVKIDFWLNEEICIIYEISVTLYLRHHNTTLDRALRRFLYSL